MGNLSQADLNYFEFLHEQQELLIKKFLKLQLNSTIRSMFIALIYWSIIVWTGWALLHG
jgi:hypothetical protein